MKQSLIVLLVASLVCQDISAKNKENESDRSKTSGASDYPWFVTLYQHNYCDSYFCSGSLITSRHVLTAAICFHSTSTLTQYQKTGKSDTIIDTTKAVAKIGGTTVCDMDSTTTQLSRIAYWTIHPGFTGIIPFTDNVALVMVKSRFKPTEYARPIQVHTDDLPEFTVLQTAGFRMKVNSTGKFKTDPEKREKLTKKSVRLVPSEVKHLQDCIDAVRINLSKRNQMCTSEALKTGFRGTGAVIEHFGQKKLVGLRDYSSGGVTVFTKISDIKDWLTDAVFTDMNVFEYLYNYKK